MSRDTFRLLDAIHLPLNRPEYQPHGSVTHCNQYVDEVCMAYGFKGLGGLLANEIIALVSNHEQWIDVSLNESQALANTGTLIIAGAAGTPHGHVNVICPGKEKVSSRWSYVPSCANVGKEVFIGKGVNWAFSSMPKCWAWRPSLQ